MEEILDLVAQGEGIASICKKYGMSRYQYASYLQKDTLFSQKIKEAKKIYAESLVNGLIGITKGAIAPVDASCAKIESDNIKWLASKIDRENYGDTSRIDVHQTLDLAPIIAKAEQRLVPIRDLTKDAIDVTPVESDTSDDETTDIKSVDDDKPESFDDLL